MSEHVIKIDRIILGNWITGTVDGMEFEAKVYDEGSKFGIDDGRVSKLAIYDANPRREVAGYDRGWDNYPAPGKYEDAHDALVQFCAKLPPMEQWNTLDFHKEYHITLDEGEKNRDCD